MNVFGVFGHPQMRDNDAPLLFTFTGSTRYVPLMAAAGLFAGAIVLSLVGPINWQMDNAVEVYGFLVAYLAALVAGYLWAVRRTTTKLPSSRWRLPHASAIVIVGSVVYLLLYPLTVYDSTGSWFPNVVEGLTDPGQAYDDKTAAALQIPQLAVYLGTVVSPLTIAVMPLTLFFWPRLSRVARLMGVVVLVLTLALGVSRAVNQDVGEVCGYLVLFLVLVASTKRDGMVGRWKRVVVCSVGAALVCGLFISYYHVVISGRVEADADAASEATGPAQNPVAPSSGASEPPQGASKAMEQTALVSTGVPRAGSVFYSVVPAAAQPTGVMFTSYLTQGYKGLSLAMDSPWRPTYGLGFSTFIRHNASRVLGLDEARVEARTYEGQISAQGWTAGQQWSTFFVHPASDLSFVGVIPLIVLLGFGFGAAWRDTCVRKDPFACVVFFYLGIEVLYLSANNQLYQGGELAVGFTVALVAWLVFRSGRRHGSSREGPREAVGASVTDAGT